MTTAFKLLCQSCGLSMREATAFLGVRPDTAKHWWLGARTVKPSVLHQLHDLYREIDNAADEAYAAIQDSVNCQGHPPEQIEIGVASDDHEAQSLGFPCVGTHEAVIRRAIEKLPPALAAKIVIVPRGSTPATAAAAEIHQK